MFKNYFKTTLRILERSKLYSSINIAGLSIGLACAMLIILYVKDELSYDRFLINVSHIYRIDDQQINADGSLGDQYVTTGYFHGPKYKADIPEIQAFVRLFNGSMDIKNGSDVQSQQVSYADSNFFTVFSFPLLTGNPKTALLQPHSVVISEKVAKNQFGTVNAMGKIMMLKEEDQFMPYTVSAVAKNCPQNSSIKFDFLLPLKVSKKDEEDNLNWYSLFLNTFVALASDADPKKVEVDMKKAYLMEAKEATKIVREKYGVKKTDVNFLQPFTDIHLNKDLPPTNGLTDASNTTFSYILSGIALFILLIACINFVNLTIARSLKRAKEIGIRKVIGGERKQLVLQFLGESYLLCFAAFIFAVIIVEAVLPVFNNLSNKALSLSYLLDTKLVAGYIALFLLTGLVAGFYPAVVLSGFNPVLTLYNRFQFSGKNYIQKILVVLQFALASFLIIATLTIFSQFNYLTSEKLGYDDTNLITVYKSGMSRADAALLGQKLMKNPNIIEVAPKNRDGDIIAKVNGDSILQFKYERVDEKYIPLLNIPMVNGRNFSKDIPSDSNHSVLVNERFVQKAGWKNPIGQQVNFWFYDNSKYSVIGVVKNHHYHSLYEEIGPELFTMSSKRDDFDISFIKIRPNSATSSLLYIEKTFKKLFPLSPFSYQFKDQENFNYYQSEAKWKQMMLFGAILTIFISSIGLFGLSVMSTERRTKEIGIRKVLGASVIRISGILSKDFLFLVSIAMIIALPIAWIAANKWLQSYPYRIELNWIMFASAGFLVVLIATATVSFQSIKAAIANPAKSLRTD
jgi:putative ABC transport system permease protein